jgi:hypothetical protein
MRMHTKLLLGGTTLLLGLTPAAWGQSEAGRTPVKADAEIAIPMGPMKAGMEAPQLEGAAIVPRVPCPHPSTQTINATGTPQGGPDFPAAWNGHYASGLNDPSPNHIFAYTFHFKWPSPDRVCCELVGAVLTVKVKCLNDIPENDTWAVVNNGVGVPGSGGKIGWPAGCNGQTKTLTWTATPAMLSQMNAEGTDPHLSFAVQDDTSVLSASLQLTECCVLKHSGRPGDM